MCNKCIEKHDHHSVWFDKCIGVNNYRYYLAFIISTTILSGYIIWLGLHILTEHAHRNKLFEQDLL